ncbi:MAG: retroviral-like aspartic protease family protein [Treponema sp.]|nr:retroviral-like aspartic protease family protein [Treponema sp.]
MEREVRTVKATVDTGCGLIAIGEAPREKLGLEKRTESTLADGSKPYYGVTEPVRICWQDCPAVVLPDAGRPFWGPFRWKGLT